MLCLLSLDLIKYSKLSFSFDIFLNSSIIEILKKGVSQGNVATQL